jgi:hypothetical protein
LVWPDQGLEPTIYHTRGEHANNYTSDMINLKLSWQYFDITGQTSAPQPALILSSDSIGVGSTFELQCKVYIDRGGSVFMTWTYSSNEVGSNVP